MKQILFFLLATFYCLNTSAQIVPIVTNPNNSGNIVIGGSNYHVSESIYLNSEIGNANFTTAGAAILNVDYFCSAIGTGSTVVASPNFKIYMKDVPSATTTLATGAYSTAGYTLVYSGSFSYPATGWQGVALQTPYVRAAGTNLQVLIERTDNVVHTGNNFSSSNGNTVAGSAALSSRRYNLSAAPVSGTSSLTATNFRPQIRLRHLYPNDGDVTNVYTLGKLPIPNGAPRTDSANITNIGLTAMMNIPVTLNITGANSFTDVQTIASLAPGASAKVVFAPYTPTNQGTNNITVSVPSDDNDYTNTLSVAQIVNANTWSYAYSTIASGGVGFTGATGDFVAKFNTNTAMVLSQVTVNFFVGGQPFQIGVWDATGTGGAPGANLYTSVSQTSVAGVNVLPVTPLLSIPAGDFYVGVRQTGTVNVSFAYQAETPIRAKTFYFTSPSGGTTWTDFAPANSFRFMIEPKLILPTDASLSNLNLNLPSPAVSCNSTSNPSVVLNNPGINAIPAGSASVTFKSAGANSNFITQTNVTTISSGGSEVITFTGANFANAGINFDTAYVVYPGDQDKSGDTVKIQHTTAPTITAFPAVENAESTLPVFPYTAIVSGTRQLWTVQTGNYTNPTQTLPLVPHGGTKFYLFDSYTSPTSAGFTSRLYSNCLTLPAAGAGICNNQLNFWMSHDNTTALATSLDSLYVSVSTDKGATWTRFTGTTERFGRQDGTLTANAAPIWRKETINLSAYAGQTVQIGFEGVSKFGNAFGLDDITIGSSAGNNLALATNSSNGISLVKDCDDQGYTYYIDPANPSVSLLAIKWDPSNTGANSAAKAAAIPKIQLDANDFAAENVPLKKATYTMKRYWNVNLNGSTMTGPVDVRFFYSASEKNTTNAAAAAFASANNGVQETSSWFKTVSGDFVADAAHVNENGVVNSILLTDVNSSGATINGVLYAQFDGITSFSGGTFASGVGPGIVLTTGLLNFSGQRAGAVNKLTWRTSSEENNLGFDIQRSDDGVNFKVIDFINSGAIGGNSSTPLTYNFTDAKPGASEYYRLRQVDISGHSKYSNVILIKGAASLTASLYSVYPNPARNTINLLIALPNKDKVTILISDIAGRKMMEKVVDAEAGNNTIQLDIKNLNSGTYLVKLVCNNNCESALSKFVKQ